MYKKSLNPIKENSSSSAFFHLKCHVRMSAACDREQNSGSVFILSGNAPCFLPCTMVTCNGTFLYRLSRRRDLRMYTKGKNDKRKRKYQHISQLLLLLLLVMEWCWTTILKQQTNGLGEDFQEMWKIQLRRNSMRHKATWLVRRHRRNSRA